MSSIPVLVAACLVAVVVVLTKRRSKRLPFPPGPRGLPFIGNFLDSPKTNQWLTYEEWGRRYGSDILYYRVLGASIVVLNSLVAANELLEKRSARYSDRPPRPMINDLLGFTWDMGFMPYGEAWKDRRKLFHKMLFSAAGFPRQEMELRAIRVLLRRILEKPEDRLLHLRHFAASLIIEIAYGIKLDPENDPYVEIAERAMHSMSMAGNSGSYLVDYVPLLKYIPEWLPGAGFKKQARDERKFVTAVADMPFGLLKAAHANGTAVDSVGKRLLDNLSEDNSSDIHGRKERIAKDVLAVMYSGGSDSTVSTFDSFFLVMVQNPDIQKKAQACVDSLISTGSEGHRSPGFSDRGDNSAGNSAYIEALLREILRWEPVTPLADPHCVLEDDDYRGYCIPAGSFVVGNIWMMLHDERVYPDPYVFNPERWLKDGKLNPDVPDPSVAFGFGRRICPGQELAKSTLWILMVSVLASFDIENALDENGVPIDVPTDYWSGLIRHPKPFRCNIKPRNKNVEALIKLESSA